MLASSTHSKKSLHEVIDNLPLAVCVISSDITVWLANKAILQYVNRDQENILDKRGGEALRCTNHFAEPNGCGFGVDCLRCKLRETLHDTIQNHTVHRSEQVIMNLMHSGERLIRIYASPIDIEGETKALLAVEDITTLMKHKEDELAHERLKAAMQTSGAVCHEMNQPLQSLTTQMELLQQTAAKDPDFRQKLDQLQADVKRLGSFTQKLSQIHQFRTKPYLADEHILDVDASAEE